MHDIRSFRRQELVGGSVFFDIRRNNPHGGGCDIGGIRHGDQLNTGTTQDGLSMVLSMTTGAD
jgi:hypothetical protein